LRRLVKPLTKVGQPPRKDEPLRKTKPLREVGQTTEEGWSNH
jgi:hypothetical protein